jgi:16S rRNA (guanine966-N2)-methyltransferase
LARSSAPTISGGEFRGRRLAVPEGKATRPARGRVREAMFGMVAEHVLDARVLDIYAGSGSLGLEALSRGAAHATFVERWRVALGCLRANIETCGVGPDRARVLPVDVSAWRALPDEPFDLVFADPPFALLEPLPPELVAPGVLAPDARVVVETPSERFTPTTLPGLELLRRREHGRSSICVYGTVPQTPPT